MGTAAKTLPGEVSEPVTGTPDPVDVQHLRRYTLGDQCLEREVLALFIDHVPVTLEALRRARTSDDWKRAAHTLKGSARAVGAWRMAKLAESAESLSDPADRSACDQLLRRLEQERAEAQAYIASLESAC